MDFIFMLTRDDRTVTDCLAVLDTLSTPDSGDAQDPGRGSAPGIDHIGFKDVGVDPATLARLHRRIKDRGATSYLEVVSTTRAEALASVRTAVDLGVDWLMGGVWIEETLALLAGTGTRYLPFAGEPRGHPTRLAGDPARIAEDCRRAEAAGCAGVDLLAFRAVDADPLDLVRAARAATAGRLVVAGSITTPARIHALAEAGADAFTIGSAAFSGALRPDAGTLGAQLTAIVEATTAARTVARPGAFTLDK
ncbi:HisA/HisF-related TIM barrel protein [Streptomyces sp. NPDC008121]|uniref:HisA/HisF-related TIM barrel protein n=1 Tax=Streptomyces sp. NPDC008121 TaxID=3364809 RepID=UPI0036F003D3